MNTLEQMNKAMDYIEEHLFSELDYQMIFKISGCSEYHFRRMFSFLSNISLGEYIRSRKLSQAATLLKTSSIKVIDLAFLLGYESSDAFSKAFTSFHNISPTNARKSNAVIKNFSPMKFHLTIKGGTNMNYKIVDKESFFIVGFKKRITLVYHGVNPQIQSLYEKLTPKIIQELKQMNTISPTGIISASTNFSERTIEGTELDQYIGVVTAKQISNSQFDILPVEASTWVVFEVKGPFPETLQETWAQIYSQWLPSSGYEVNEGPEILWNKHPDTTDPNYESEIWIPIKKSQ